MSFHDVLLDPALSYGTDGGPQFDTKIMGTASGHEYRVARTASSRHVYRFDKRLMAATEWADLLGFFAARRGNLHSFRFFDHRDHSTAVDGVSAPTNLDEAIGTGDGVQTQFQLVAEYDTGGLNPYLRPITLPVDGSVVVAFDGSPNTDWSLSNPGGVLTFNDPVPDGTVITAGFEFHVPVRFSSTDEWLRLRLTPGDYAEAPLECIEVKNEIETPELWYPGGCSDVIETAVDQRIDYSLELWRFDPTADIDVYLPPPDRVPGGPRMFVVHVIAGASNDASVVDDAGNPVVGPLSSGETATIALLRSGSTATWMPY